MKDEIIPQLRDFITSEILQQPGRDLADDQQLISSGLIDSLSLVDISIFVEDEFQVTIDDTELNADTFDTLGELEDLILSRKNS